MNEKQPSNPVAEDRERAVWQAPRVTRMVAGNAELGPNPAADAGSLS